jgi:hypothetical protein
MNQHQKVVVDAPRFWAAAAVCAVIAGLAALVVFWAITDVLAIDLYVRDFPDTSVIVFLSGGRAFLVAFVGAVLAAAVLHLMLLFVVRPTWFFGVLSLLVLAVGIIVPFTIDVPTESQVSLMILNTIVGVVTLSLLLGTVPLVTRVFLVQEPLPPPAPPPPPFQ